jgi:hypothetical protein
MQCWRRMDADQRRAVIIAILAVISSDSDQ